MTSGGASRTGRQAYARRRWLLAGVTAAAVLMGLAGCGLPSGVDGKLANEWSMPPAAQEVQAKVGDCRSATQEQVNPVTETMVPCSGTHNREIVYIGEFTGASAALSSPPTLQKNATGAAAAAQAEAYAECSKQASAYVGHAWYDVRLDLNVVLPNSTAWAAGRKWYRCELQQVDWYSFDDETREGSLKDFTYPIRCMNFANDESREVGCATKHNGEYVGTFTALSQTRPKTSAQYAAYHTKCRSLAAPYLGVTVAQVRYLTGTYVWFSYNEDYAASGRQDVHCFLWYGETKSMTGTAKGKRGTNLPK
ncbi:septum formation family protein [Hamadaea sp. NPDC050747]|uniref:septum formation family protein n=1 Tax=Hamadaea sp. NPDC050747 TaxID=3155789 RepID=UPI0033FDFB79